MPVECRVNGGFCRNALCASGSGCEAEANRILGLDPDEMEQAINDAAAKLGLNPELFGQFVYDMAFGAGSSGDLNTDAPSPF